MVRAEPDRAARRPSTMAPSARASDLPIRWTRRPPSARPRRVPSAESPWSPAAATTPASSASTRFASSNNGVYRAGFLLGFRPAVLSAAAADQSVVLQQHQRRLLERPERHTRPRRRQLDALHPTRDFEQHTGRSRLQRGGRYPSAERYPERQPGADVGGELAHSTAGSSAGR